MNSFIQAVLSGIMLDMFHSHNSGLHKDLMIILEMKKKLSW